MPNKFSADNSLIERVLLPFTKLILFQNAVVEGFLDLFLLSFFPSLAEVQGLLMILYLGITSDRSVGPHMILGIKSESTMSKGSALHTVLSSWLNFRGIFMFKILFKEATEL